jgi:hypothetical protein
MCLILPPMTCGNMCEVWSAREIYQALVSGVFVEGTCHAYCWPSLLTHQLPWGQTDTIQVLRNKEHCPQAEHSRTQRLLPRNQRPVLSLECAGFELNAPGLLSQPITAQRYRMFSVFIQFDEDQLPYAASQCNRTFPVIGAHCSQCICVSFLIYPCCAGTSHVQHIAYCRKPSRKILL